ncbi:polar growth protein [Podochytrium sp. JEL0797]|nr:polar growth protein [Podochytrium sp. JEL0797]
MKTDYISSVTVVGRGINLGPNNNIVCEAGWDTEAMLEGACVISVKKPLRNCRIQVEFRGYCETRFQGGKVATAREGSSITKVARIFQQQVEVCYDSHHPLSPTNSAAVSLPFRFKLPKKNMPPSFDSPGGSIEYFIKCSVLFQEGGLKLLKTNVEVEVPVLITMPQVAIWNLMSAPSPTTQQLAGTFDKIGFTLHIPKRILTIGDSLELHVTIESTPGETRLRSMNAALRPAISYMNAEGFSVQSKSPRPLSEFAQAFPMVSLKPLRTDPIVRRIYLQIDAELAKCSLESPLISVKTMLRLQMVLDNSETPNISVEIPIVVVPANREGYQAPGGSIHSSSASIYSVAGNGVLLARSNTLSSTAGSQQQQQEQQQQQQQQDSFLNVLSSPLQSPQRMYSQTSLSPTSPSSYFDPAPSPSPSTGSDLRHPPIPNNSRSGLPSPPMNRSGSRATTSMDIPRATATYQQFQQPPQQLQQRPAAEPQRSNTTLQQGDMATFLNELTVNEKSALSVTGPIKYDTANAVPAYAAPTNGSTNGSLRNAAGPTTGSTDRESVSSAFDTLPETWTVANVAEWVKGVGASPEVVQRFLDNEIDGAVLLTLSADDLKDELGVVAFGIRRKMTVAIEKMKQAGL